MSVYDYVFRDMAQTCQIVFDTIEQLFDVLGVDTIDAVVDAMEVLRAEKEDAENRVYDLEREVQQLKESISANECRLQFLESHIAFDKGESCK